jgi:hypothetical protein
MKTAFIALFFCLTVLAAEKATKPQITLDDLGFKKDDFTVDSKLGGVDMEKRSRMLKAHQYFAMGAAAVMTANLFTGPEGHTASSSHKWLGISAGLLYYTAASFALLAPKPTTGENEKGNIVWHKRLAYIHGPLMVLAPVLGYLANEKYKKGEQLSGLPKQHKTVAVAAYIPFMISLGLMTFEF